MIAAAAPFDAAEANRRLAAAGAGSRLRLAESVDSTNRWAMTEADAGAPHLTWFAADTQTAGRGRLGRAWVSPPGKNLYVSCVLRPDLAPAQAPLAGLAAALAVQRAVTACGVTGARVKWPNDVHAAGGKLAGILSEMKAQPERVEALVVGIGLNVAMTADDFPPGLMQPATSLRIEGSDADRTAAFTALALAFEELMGTLSRHGFAALRDEWNAASLLNGRRVTVEFSGRTAEGVVRGLDAEGFLELETAGGRELIVAGDVTVKK